MSGSGFVLNVRVIDQHGQGDEFSILAALQFLRFLNSHADRLLVHGVILFLGSVRGGQLRLWQRLLLCPGVPPACTASGVVVAAAGEQKAGIAGASEALPGRMPPLPTRLRTTGISVLQIQGTRTKLSRSAAHTAFSRTNMASLIFRAAGRRAMAARSPILLARREGGVACTPGKRRGRA